MPEKTTPREKQTLAGKTDSENESENDKTGKWSEDQKEKSYYYDDSYGYEVYNPNEDEDDNEKD